MLKLCNSQILTLQFGQNNISVTVYQRLVHQCQQSGEVIRFFALYQITLAFYFCDFKE